MQRKEACGFPPVSLLRNTAEVAAAETLLMTRRRRN
jgi:hypothetical protein